MKEGEIEREWNFWRDLDEYPLFFGPEQAQERDEFVERVFPERRLDPRAKAPGVYRVEGGKLQLVRGGAIYIGQPRDLPEARQPDWRREAA